MKKKKQKRDDPWLRLSRMMFGADPHDGPEAARLQHRIDAGYAKTGKRSRATNVRDREREVLVKAFGDRLNGPLGKAFLNDCIEALEGSTGCKAPPGGWSHNAVRLLIKEARKPRVEPRPFSPTASELEDEGGDPSDYM